MSQWMVKACCVVFGAFVLLSLSPSSARGGSFESGVIIRVAILEGVDQLTFTSASPLTVTVGCDWSLFRQFSLPSGKGKVTVTPTRYNLAERIIKCGSFSVSSLSPISIGKRSYYGALRLYRNKLGMATLVNIVDLERYLTGVVGSEMDPEWPIEALKAQAVASRSYAYYRIVNNPNSPYHLESSVLSQVYTGADNIATTVKRAVAGTRGIIVTSQGKVAETFFHASAGGRTENAADVWPGLERPYLRSAPAPYEERTPNYHWRYSISRTQLESRLARIGVHGKLVRIGVKSYTPSGRVDHVWVQLKGEPRRLLVKATRLRSLLGTRKVRSTRFNVYKDFTDAILFTGRGYGHGVGMSQQSARGMAAQGATYQKILAHFYATTTLGTIAPPASR